MLRDGVKIMADALDKAGIGPVSRKMSELADTGVDIGRKAGSAIASGAKKIYDTAVIDEQEQAAIGNAVRGGVDKAKEGWKNWTTKRPTPKVN